ncbi:MAG TPA: hypothetical protein VII36_01215 [Usitatibacter sp.]
MRVHSRWFRRAASRGAPEVAGAMAFITWRVARSMLARMRKAGFTLDAGPRYFDFVAEALAFAIQVAWRVARERMDEAARDAFIHAIATRSAAILADNQSELLGEEASGAIEAQFIARLNLRFEEYAQFAHGPEGPDFAFLRYFASLVRDLAPESDRPWVHDQVIAIEGPEAAATVARALVDLLDESPPPRRAASSAA